MSRYIVIASAASSPEALHQSFRRRRERPEKKCREEELLNRGAEVCIGWHKDAPFLFEDGPEEPEDAPDAEVGSTEGCVVHPASTAQTIAEMKADRFIPAIVQVDGEQAVGITYVREPFGREPDFGVTSVNYRLSELLDRGGPPGRIWRTIQ